MNNFTKEELEIMRNWGDVYTDFGCSWIDKIERPLINKLQSMIDNYCEHKTLEFAGDVYGYDCRKCDRRFSYEHVGRERHERIISGEEE